MWVVVCVCVRACVSVCIYTNISFTPLRFYKQLTLVTVFVNQKKYKGDSHFYEKRRKEKMAFVYQLANYRHTVKRHIMRRFG